MNFIMIIKTKKMSKKAEKVFVRLGFEDAVVPIKDVNAVIEVPTSQYLVGYEDENGIECEEDGTYLYQDSDNKNNKNE